MKKFEVNATFIPVNGYKEVFHQINLGNEIREKSGAGELAKRVASRIKPKKDYVITSIRNKGEVVELMKFPDFILVNVISPQMNRFDRTKKRNRGYKK